MMVAYVFVGPTLAGVRSRVMGDIISLPPAAQGDVYRAARMRPRGIGIVDGYFEGAPSIWHKEILWAMSEGIHVFGSASMGALRAAELHDFGMEGIGKIFEAYRDGALEDDDEVAVLHGPAETGYAAISEPMVNIRFTLERAENAGVIVPATRQALNDLGKGLFYQERTWPALIEAAAETGTPGGELDKLRQWLTQGRIDQKRVDALAMLSAMERLLETAPEPKRVSYTFEWTELWDTATELSPTLAGHFGTDDPPLPRERLLDELRLEMDHFDQVTRQALLRVYALHESDRQRLVVAPKQHRDMVKQFRLQHGLFNRRDLDRWLTENDMAPEDFERVMAEEVKLETLRSTAEPLLGDHLLAGLRLNGQYTRLAERARRKQEVLASKGLADLDLEPGVNGPVPAKLVSWYFKDRLGLPIPDDMDDWSRQLGLKNARDFYRLLLREYLYSSFSGDPYVTENLGEGD